MSDWSIWLADTNWQENERDGRLWLEIETENGYQWPDCSVSCRHCGGCLGCIRKHIYADIHYTECEQSPTGFHEWAVD